MDLTRDLRTARRAVAHEQHAVRVREAVAQHERGAGDAEGAGEGAGEPSPVTLFPSFDYRWENHVFPTPS